MSCISTQAKEGQFLAVWWFFSFSLHRNSCAINRKLDFSSHKLLCRGTPKSTMCQEPAVVLTLNYFGPTVEPVWATGNCSPVTAAPNSSTLTLLRGHGLLLLLCVRLSLSGRGKTKPRISTRQHTQFTAVPGRSSFLLGTYQRIAGRFQCFHVRNKVTQRLFSTWPRGWFVPPSPF